MTDAEWFGCTDPFVFLDWQLERDPRPLLRELRLFVVACSRLLPGFAADPENRQVVAAVEAYADGKIPVRALRRVQRPLRGPAVLLLTRNPRHAAQGMVHRVLLDNTGMVNRDLRTEMSHFLHDILGSIMSWPWVDPAWRTPLVRSMAQGIYDAGVFEELPILADALENVGCADADLLGHLRGTERCLLCGWHREGVRHCRDCDTTGRIPMRGPHVRGCWALDAVLGRDRSL